MNQQSSNYCVIIVAAGNGTRMGTSLPKPLLPLGPDVPLLKRTLEPFLAVAELQTLCIVVPPAEQHRFEAVLAGFPEEARSRMFLVGGGASRKESVARGLGALESRQLQQSNSYVLVHDAARPFVTEALLRKVLASVPETGAVTLAIPVVDSIKEVSAGGQVVRSVPRDNLWAVQTPQAFACSLLRQAHESDNLHATDDAMLVEAFHPVSIIEGDPGNFKITTPADLEYARFVYARETGSCRPS